MLNEITEQIPTSRIAGGAASGRTNAAVSDVSSLNDKKNRIMLQHERYAACEVDRRKEW